MKNFIDAKEFAQGSDSVERPSFRGLVLSSLSDKIANIDGVMELLSGDYEVKKVRQALNNLARDGKVVRKLVNGIVYYKQA